MPSTLATLRYRRERWSTPDQDFIDLDWLDSERDLHQNATAETCSGRDLLVLFHGLEGSSRSHYAMAFAHQAKRLGMDFVVPHFRGCSGEINRAPRAYHSGDYQEIAWILERLRAQRARPLIVVGVSLGGNALLRWAQEAGEHACKTVSAIASLSAPMDLAASGLALGKGLNRYVYTPMFLRTMKPKAMEKLRQYPGLFDPAQLLAARNLYDFDNVFTAPLHGFKDTVDYWQRASAKPHLDKVAVPCLVLNAINDPFVPANSLPNRGVPSAQKTTGNVRAAVALWQPRHGGHAGFGNGSWPSHMQDVPTTVIGWLMKQSGMKLRETQLG